MSDGAASNTPRGDLARTVLGVLLIAILIGASFWVLRPFLLAIVWAAMIVIATWPLMLMVQARLRSRALAVTIMSTIMVLVFVVPLVLAIQTLVEHADTITGWLKTLATASIPPAPDWLSRIPLVGGKLVEVWTNVAAAGREGIVARLAPHAAAAAQWLLTALTSVGVLGIQFALTVIIAVIMYVQGEAARAGLIRFGRRLAGDRGEGVVVLAGAAIRGVALGVVVTALAQTLLAGIGLAVAGIPLAGLLTGVVLILCIAQAGPLLVLVPAVVWLFWSDQTGWGIALLIWTVIVGALDNVLRPILIRRGADLPLLLIFAGVLGGLFAFGIIGLFVGPVVLAVTYTLLRDWVREGETASQSTASRAPYHAHVYFDARDRGDAERLHRKLSAAKGTAELAGVRFVGAMRDENVGPHPKPQFEIHFLDDALPAVLALIKASGLTALVHPLTDDDLADHTSLAMWVGEPLPLDHSVLDPPGMNQGVARFGKSDV